MQREDSGRQRIGCIMRREEMRKRKTICRMFRSESGAALIWVILLFTVLSLAVTTVLMIQNADVKEVMFLENRLSAYYASYGGMEFGLAALMTVRTGGKRLLEEYIADPSMTLTPYEFKYKNASGEVVATAEISVYKKKIEGADWVVVESVGVDAFSKVRSVNYMRINQSNIYEVHRDGVTLPE